MDKPLEERRLGVDAGPARIDGFADLQLASLRLAEQARRSLELVSRDLEPRVYDTEGFREAVKTLCTGSRHASVRILLQDSTRAVKEGHRLVELARRLSSFIEIRLLGPDHRDYNEGLLIVDGAGYVHRENCERPEGGADFHGPARAEELSRRFQDLWDYSVADSNLRRLHL